MWKLVPCGVWHVLLHLIIVIQDSCTSRRHSFYSSQHHVHKMQVRYVCGRYQAKWKCRGPFQSIKNSLQLTESWDSCFQCSLALKTTKGNELQKQMLQIRDCAVTFTNKRSCIIKHVCFFIGPKYILLNLMFTFFPKLNTAQCINELVMDLPECKGSSCRAQQFRPLVHLLLVTAWAQIHWSVPYCCTEL